MNKTHNMGWLMGLMAALAVVTCVTNSPHASAQATETKTAAVDSNYRLAANDLVQVKVFREDDLETIARVNQDGMINFPLVGTVAVGGKTPEAAAAAIRSLLAKDYLVNPQVSLAVLEYDKRRFTVLGQVQKPGSYAIPDRDAINLLQAIGFAGGFTRLADPTKITVKRREAGKQSLFKLNAKTMATGEDTSGFQVMPGDVISVAESIF